MTCNAFRSCLGSFLIQQRTYTTRKLAPRVWTLEESKQLLDLVKTHGTKWALLAPHFKDRGPKSLYSRYTAMKKYTSGDIYTLVRTGSFPTDTPPPSNWKLEEDKLIIQLVRKYGNKWTEISEQLKGRSPDEIAERYTLLTDNENLKRGSWSGDEVREFDRLFSIYGDDFDSISLLLKTRTADQCRARYRYLLTLPVTVLTLSEGQRARLMKAVEEIGIGDLKLVLQTAQLPYSITVDDISKYYRRELDPKIVRDKWTKEEVELMVELYNELDGCMELVQPRLPKKRALKDMWAQYNEYKQKRLS